MGINTVKTKGSRLKHLDFIVMDFTGIIFAYRLACYIRLKQISAPPSDIYQSMFWVMLLVALLIQSIVHPHKDILKRGYYIEFIETVKLVTALVIALLIIQYLMKTAADFSRGAFVYFWLIGTVFVYLLRVLLKFLLIRKYASENHLVRLMLILSDIKLKERVEAFADHIKNHYKIAAVAVALRTESENEMPDKIGDIPVINESEMYDFAGNNVIEEVMISISDTVKEKEIVKEMMLMGITTHVNLNRVFEGMPNMHVENVADQLVITSSITPVSPMQQMIKRIMDIIGSLIGLVLSALAFIILAPLIKLKSPGPVFFTQTRVGKNGKPFKIYKFRSMYMDAEKQKASLMHKNEMNGLMFKMENDPRIIGSGPDGTRHGLGHFIRKYSIDELPQFWNILIGDMSLVGTRPPTIEEWQQYENRHKARLAIKPGLTGLWQISGRSDIIDFEEVVTLDVLYIQGWSVKQDLKIILKTIWVVLFGKGAR